MKTSFPNLLVGLVALLLPLAGRAQVNSGSNGSDGAFNPTQNVTINMTDHPDGIYQYTSVNIPSNVTVTFTPNANNKPVVWLVQGDCVVSGIVDVSGKVNGNTGGAGGPGGFRGGDAGTAASAGQGPGGGAAGIYPGNASFGTLGAQRTTGTPPQAPPGQIYGNSFLLPLIGGSGGGGSSYGGTYHQDGGGGGGGAILIATSGILQLSGTIKSLGGTWSGYYDGAGSGGSGGGVRLVTARLTGGGSINVSGGAANYYIGYTGAGKGRVRLDVMENNFSGTVTGSLTQGFQPIILPSPGQGIQLGITSIAGVVVAANPSGVLANPDIIIPAQQNNPIPLVVSCTNIPLNSEITVKVQPANGAAVTAVGLNNAGTLAASTATVSVNMPRGGGIIYATAVTGIAGGGASIGSPPDAKTPSLAETGWTASGERFVAMEITASLGGKQKIAYLTKSGKRYPAN